MLYGRVEYINSDVLFKLYPQLELPPTTPKSLVEEHNGIRYLRIDCLRNDQELRRGRRHHWPLGISRGCVAIASLIGLIPLFCLCKHFKTINFIVLHH